MTTRAIVPNADGEGSLGTSKAKWGAIYSSSPASGENSGQVPTTAWVQKLVAEALKTAKDEIYKQAKLDAHPVGSYYWSNDSTSPATLFGGTWEALPPGYTLIAQGSGSDSFGSFTYTADQKYGERKHQLTTDEMPSHAHRMDFSWGENSGDGSYTWGHVLITKASLPYDKYDPKNEYYSGKNVPHENLSPCIAAYGWRRTA